MVVTIKKIPIRNLMVQKDREQIIYSILIIKAKIIPIENLRTLIVIKTTCKITRLILKITVAKTINYLRINQINCQTCIHHVWYENGKGRKLKVYPQVEGQIRSDKLQNDRYERCY